MVWGIDYPETLSGSCARKCHLSCHVPRQRTLRTCSRSFLDETAVCCINDLISDCHEEGFRSCNECGFCMLVSTSINRIISNPIARRSIRSPSLRETAENMLWQILAKVLARSSSVRSLNNIQIFTWPLLDRRTWLTFIAPWAMFKCSWMYSRPWSSCSWLSDYSKL